MTTKLQKVSDIEVHEMANLTPAMTEVKYNALKDSINTIGQLLPIVIYRGRCVDGRHRLKAFRELGLEDILATTLNSQLSIEEVKEMVLNGYEQRRHQTPTQLAIMTFNEWNDSRKSGENITQGALALKYGVSVKQLGRVKVLHELAGNDIITLLFNGHKVNIGTAYKPHLTDSLDSLIHHFKKYRESIIELTPLSMSMDDFTDDEIASIERTIDELQNIYSGRLLKQLNKKLFAILNRE